MSKKKKLQFLVLQRVCQALTDAEIPFERVWCTRIEDSEALIYSRIDGKFTKRMAMVLLEDKSMPLKKKRENLQFFFLLRVSQALTDAKIPFEAVWCKKMKNSDSEALLYFTVNGIEYVKEIDRAKEKVA